jgi:hypothetical protein
MDPLTTSLLDLLYELREQDIPLIVGGGFGLFLKRQHVTQSGMRTLIDAVPDVRSTNDIDLFCRAEVIADLNRARTLAAVLARLGYQPVEQAKYLQWRRGVTIAGVVQEIKIDLLVGPIDEVQQRLHVKHPRVRPKGGVKLHAYCAPEAVEVEVDPIVVNIAGRRACGDFHAGMVFVPQAFPYLMMKLHAFDDRKDDARKDVGRHHALDLYSIVGLMTEAEYERAVDLARDYRRRHNPHVDRAWQIVLESFSRPSALGLLRLREHPLYRGEFALDVFVDVLHEIFCSE